MPSPPRLRHALACLLLALPGAWARADTPRFEPVGDPTVLRDGVVSALALDAQGFLWLGTPDGAYRFDGYGLKGFPLPGTPERPVPDQFTRALLADPRGGLWMSAGSAGLAWLDTAAGRWTRWVRHGDTVDGRAPASNTIGALALAPDGTLWLGTPGAGLDSLDPQRRRFTHHVTANSGLQDDRINTLLVDRRGTLWIGTWQGLARKRAGSDRIEPLDLGLRQQRITLVAETADGHVLVGTGSGGMRLLAGDGSELPFDRRDGARGSRWPLLSLLQVSADELWLGHAGGLERRRASDGALLESLTPDVGNATPVPPGEVRALLRDAAGTRWASSFGGGLMRHQPALPGLRMLRHDAERWRSDGELDVRSILQLRSGEVWLGTQSGGIEILDRDLQPLARIPPGSAHLPASRINALAQTGDGSVWAAVGTELLRFDPSGRWRETVSSGTSFVRRLHATADGGLWCGTLDGLLRWQPGSKRLVAVDIVGGHGSPGGEPASGELNSFVPGPDGSLWVGGSPGLVRIRHAATDHAVAQLVPTIGLGPTVLGLAADAQGQLWADTSTGLHRLVGQDGPRLRFEPQAPGPGAFGANLLFDRQGRLWTQRAMFDPATGQRRELKAADGADLGTGWFRAYAALDDGRMLFGGTKGVLVVSPERFAPWAFQPQVVATELRVGSQPQPLPGAGQALVLPPGQRSLQLGFTALDFSEPTQNRYRYRLDGLDADWLEADALARRAAYTNLEPGRYVLHVQGSNRVGTWSPHQLTLPIDVRPAWWQTPAVRVAAVGLGGLLLLAAVRLRVRLLLRRQAELEAHVASATAELQRKSQALEEASLTDPLTGLRNRRFLAQRLPGDVALAIRRHEDATQYGRQPSPPEAAAGDGELLFFLIDVDHFKPINDRHGHTAGDAVLQQMRGRLQQVFRATDDLVRWGGEEFLIVARGTPRERAAELAERARQAVQAEPFLLDGGLPLALTCSVGFSVFPLCPAWPRALDWRTAIDQADMALYAAKKAGRNRWAGLVAADASGADTLQADAQGPLAAWAASGRLRWRQSP